MLQFGGLAIMPFALIILSGDTNGPAWIGSVAAGLAFLLVGAGLHTTQTAGLALATDLAPQHARPRVVAFLYVMMLIGMVASSLTFGALLSSFSQVRLIQVIQGAAAITMILNIVALWKQEARAPSRTRGTGETPRFRDAWAALGAGGKASRVLVSVGLGSAAFSMQDILHMSVGATTSLTGLQVLGTLAGLYLAARQLARQADPYRLAGYGVLVGLMAFPAVIFAGPAESPFLLRLGALLIGFGGGLFSVGTLTAAMTRAAPGQSGLALGVWGAVQASASGLAIALGGAMRDGIARIAESGAFGAPFTGSLAGYSAVYHIEVLLLLATLVAIGPLVRSTRPSEPPLPEKFGLAEFPG
jgi:BCD family chlorophyll transporter-like MFS transporter